tara:strand:- start:6666 stop:7052 length:387 start_codon:yes stop_codon:yes gene_type:complete
MVNEYRLSKNMNLLMWDVKCYEKSKTHNTSIKLENQYIRHNRNLGWGYSEIITLVSKNLKDSDTTHKELSTLIFMSWKNSKPHNRIMLKNQILSGVSCKVLVKPNGIKGWCNYVVISTMVFTKLPNKK